MKFGFVVPWADAEDVGELAAAAEDSGWDGLFVWEPVWGVDAWISLGLAAVRTSKIRLGTLLTPPSRRRPWELAEPGGHRRPDLRRTGDPVGGPRSDRFGLRRVRRGVRPPDTFAELMDECLDIMCGLWGGQPFSYDGSHYRCHRPSSRPSVTRCSSRGCRSGASERSGGPSMERAMRWDGLIPQVIDGDGGARQPTSRRDSPDLRSQLVAGAPTDYDIVVEGVGDRALPRRLGRRRRHLVDRVDVGRDARGRLPHRRRDRPPREGPADA
jgi:hypothetical protein